MGEEKKKGARERGMTRLEENTIVIDEITKKVKSKPIGTYEEIVTFQLGTIATMLSDISKSLAIIADKANGGEKK